MFLVDFFARLNERKVQYLVLRGYKDLPHNYNNDIDFGVYDYDSLVEYFKVIKDLSNDYNFELKRDEVRVGLIKVVLDFNDSQIKLDIFTDFRYAGLQYIDNENLHRTKRILESGIHVPSLEYELCISLLKEFLHNSRIRKDKHLILRSQYVQHTFKTPFSEFFTVNSITNFREALFANGNLVFIETSKRARHDLLKSNVRKFGSFNVFLNVVKFFTVKYFQQTRYDKAIFNVR